MHRSRGKGSRRVERRDGGARKRRRPVWRKNAHHAVGAVSDLRPPTKELRLPGSVSDRVAKIIYLFDQKIAEAGIAYHAGYLGKYGGFAITVEKRSAPTVQAIIDELAGSYWHYPPDSPDTDS